MEPELCMNGCKIAFIQHLLASTAEWKLAMRRSSVLMHFHGSLETGLEGLELAIQGVMPSMLAVAFFGRFLARTPEGPSSSR